MPWGRVDDTWYDHPKLELLPDSSEWPDRLAAAGLNSLAWSWCNRFLTDGYIPRRQVEKLGGTMALADALVAIGLWESAAGGYQVHDFLVYNESREQTVARREKEANRKAEWRRGKRHGGTDDGTANGGAAIVPPSVPPSVPPGQADDPGPDVPLGHAHARRVARIPTRPDPTESSKKAPNAQNRAPEAAAPVMKNGADPDHGVTLTKDQLAAWSSFGPEWDGFRAAWLSKGLRLPPAGKPDDDDTSQRGLLWGILDARPTSLVEWIAEAPGGSARKVIDHVLARWHDVRAEAGVETEDWFAGDTPSAAAESLAGILKRIPGAGSEDTQP